MSYRDALPYLLKKNGWSYRDLDHQTGKSASYWNQTVRKEGAAPQTSAIYELLGDLFRVKPEFFREYYPIKASELVLNDPKIAYEVVKRVGKRGRKNRE